MYKILLFIAIIFSADSALAADKKLYMSVEDYTKTRFEGQNHAIQRLNGLSKLERQKVLKTLKAMEINQNKENKEDIKDKKIDLNNVEDLSNYLNQNIDNNVSDISYHLLDIQALSAEEEAAYRARQEQKKQLQNQQLQKQQAAEAAQKAKAAQESLSPSVRRRFSR